MSDLTDKQQRYLGNINSCAQDLLFIINGILDLSKIEAGKLEMDRTLFRLDELLQALVAVVGLKVAEKKLELIFDIDPSIPDPLVGDCNLLKQILNNLIYNAIKFTEHGEVIVRVALEEGDKLRFTIKDSGIGMSEEQRGQIFQSYT